MVDNKPCLNYRHRPPFVKAQSSQASPGGGADDQVLNAGLTLAFVVQELLKGGYPSRHSLKKIQEVRQIVFDAVRGGGNGSF